MGLSFIFILLGVFALFLAFVINRRQSWQRARGLGRISASKPWLQSAKNMRPLTRETWLLACLEWLAEIAWAYETEAPRSHFLLEPHKLPVPHNEDTCEEVLSILFMHAGFWAPGLEVPVEQPTVVITGDKSDGPVLARVRAGTYGTDDRGKILVKVAPDYITRPEACLSILCHEGCHWILDGSCLGIEYCLPPDPSGGDRLEQVTDLAMFVLGFGKIFLQGYCLSHETRIGYLQPREYELAQKWVLNGRGIEDPGELMQFLRDSYGIRRYPRIPGIPEYRRWVMAKLIELVYGDEDVAAQLMKYEAQLNPKIGEIGAAQQAIRKLIRDRQR